MMPIASFNPNFFDPYSFVIVASPQTFYDYKELEFAMRSTLKKIIHNDITDEQVAKAKKDILYSFEESFSNLSKITNIIANNVANGQSIKDITNFHSYYAQITTKDVKNAAEKHFKNPPRLIAAGVSLPPLESDQ